MTERVVFNVAKDNHSLFLKTVQENIIEATILGLPIGLKKRAAKDETKSKMSIMLSEHIPAPYWFYSKERQQHYIFIKDVEQAFLKNQDNKSQQDIIKNLSLSTFLHEYGHALYTLADIETISKILKKEETPFDMVNIFEDIRIENLISNNYLEGESLLQYAKVPLSFYSTSKTIDPKDSFYEVLGKMLATQARTVNGLSNPYYDEINKYCEKAIHAKNTLEVAWISIEFYKKYKEYLPFSFDDNEEKKDKEQNSKIPNQSKNQQEQNKNATKILSKTLSDIVGQDANKDEDEDDDQKVKDKEELQAGKNIEQLKILLSPGSFDCSPKTEKEVSEDIKNATSLQVSMSAASLSKAAISLPSHAQKTNYYKTIIDNESNTASLIDLKATDRPTISQERVGELKAAIEELRRRMLKKKIKTPNRTQGELNIDNCLGFLTKTNINAPLYLVEKENAKKFFSIHIIYDASGSMYGESDEKGKILLSAINEMAKEGLDAKLTVTKVIGSTSLYQTVQMPIKIESIYSIYTNGSSEGLAPALKGSLISEQATKKDVILFLTDGIISCEERDKLLKLLQEYPNVQKKICGVYLSNQNSYNKAFFREICNNKMISTEDIAQAVSFIYDIAKGTHMFARNNNVAEKKRSATPKP